MKIIMQEKIVCGGDLFRTPVLTRKSAMFVFSDNPPKIFDKVEY